MYILEPGYRGVKESRAFLPPLLRARLCSGTASLRRRTRRSRHCLPAGSVPQATGSAPKDRPHPLQEPVTCASDQQAMSQRGL